MVDWTKEELIDILQYTLLPPLNAKELESNSVKDYQTRLTRLDAQFVSEIYHENSKLNEYNVDRLITQNALIKDVKEWYLSTACNIQDDVIDNRGGEVFRRLGAFSSCIEKILAELKGKEALSSLFYSIDLLILDEGRLYRFLPRKDYLILEKTVSDEERKELRVWMLQKPSPQQEDGMLFIVGAPWRNMIFYGQRGYRQMLFDAGFFFNAVQSIGQDQHIAMNTYTLFYDNKINKLLNLDGVETYALGVISISS